MNDELPQPRRWKDLDEPSVDSGPTKIGLERKILGGALALAGVALFFIAAAFPITHIGFFNRSNQGPQPNLGLIWLAFALLYCAALAGLVRTEGGGSRVALGCFGAILFAFAFIAAVTQSM